jgi:hypothetical protein
VRRKFGVEPALIPDFLALVAASRRIGYPGIPGIGAVGAARLLNRYGAIETFPPRCWARGATKALLFKTLATLRTDAPLFRNVDRARVARATAAFSAMDERIGAPRPSRGAAEGRGDARERIGRREGKRKQATQPSRLTTASRAFGRVSAPLSDGFTHACMLMA